MSAIEGNTAKKYEEELLTVPELAKKLKTDPSWVYGATRKGLIPVVKIGKYNRYRLSEVLSALEAG